MKNKKGIKKRIPLKTSKKVEDIVEMIRKSLETKAPELKEERCLKIVPSPMSHE